MISRFYNIQKTPFTRFQATIPQRLVRHCQGIVRAGPVWVFVTFPVTFMANATRKENASGNKAPQSAAEVEQTNKPVKVFREEDISASIFARTANGRMYRSVSFSRSYRDQKTNTFCYTHYFNSGDMEKLAKVLSQVQSYLNEQD